MADVDQLIGIVQSLRDHAKKFSDAATTLQQQNQHLDWSAADLASSSATWAGQGNQAFQTAWQIYHDYTTKSMKWLNGTSDALNKLAQKIDDQVQQIQNAQAAIVGMSLLTIGLGILDVAQLGLDPLTDAATAGSGTADAAAINEVEMATSAIAEVDVQAEVELDNIVSEIQDATDLPNMDNIDGDAGYTDMSIDGSPSDDTMPEDPSSPIGASGGPKQFFPSQYTSEYNPTNPVIEQDGEKACGASCIRMLLQEEGIDVSEADAAAEGELNPQEGMNPQKVPDALNNLSKTNNYTFSRSYSITDAVAKANGKPIITGVFNGYGHGIVVDGIEGSDVLVRDPAGSAYKVPISIFNRVWENWVVSP